jgi:hypothetical protein
MPKPARKIIYLSILIGLFTVQPVPAIDGDYGNPYANSPGSAQGTINARQVDSNWKGVPVYGGKDRKLPLMTLVGAGLLLIGVGTGGYCQIREYRQRINA